MVHQKRRASKCKGTIDRDSSHFRRNGRDSGLTTRCLSRHTMTRRKPHEPYVQIKVNLPAILNGAVEELLWDPVLKKPRYGSRSDLIQSLLTRWVEDQKGPPSPPLQPTGARTDA